jgi:hypothetical protein
MSETLAAFSDAELKAELSRRKELKDQAHWDTRKANAKYLCLGCGTPDSWHTRGCPIDTSG